MYVADERFKAYYDNTIVGGAEYLNEAVIAYYLGLFDLNSVQI